MRDLLPPPILVADEDSLGQLVRALVSHPVVAVDTESNSLHAYRERICLIQFSTPAADHILDPLKLRDLHPLAPLLPHPDQQKVFHAAEYDLICLRRDYDFAVTNIFDTMSAARTLGWPQVGLAAVLDTHFGVTLDKKYQRADWKRRPLTPEQLDYARLDTHYLVALRDRQLQALTESGHWPEAQENSNASPWRVATAITPTQPRPSGASRCPRPHPPQAAILQASLRIPGTAGQRMIAPFRVMGEEALLALARRAPRRPKTCRTCPHDARIKSAATRTACWTRSSRAPLSSQLPPQVDRESDDVIIDTTASASGEGPGEGARVESDVILPRTALWIWPASTAHTWRNWRRSPTSVPGGGGLRGRDSEGCSLAPALRRSARDVASRD